MNALNIAYKDLQIFFKDRGAVLQLFALPLVFIIAINAAAAGFSTGNEQDSRIPLPVVDLDGGEAAQMLLEGLNSAGGVQIEMVEQSEATTLLDEDKIRRVLTIPADFSAGFKEGRTVTLQILNHSDANPEETEAVRLVVEGVAQGMSLESQILASLQQMGEMQANSPEEFQEAFAVEKTIAQAKSQFESAEARPLITIVQTIPGEEAEREELPGIDEVAVPGFTVLFVFMVAQSTARSIYDEKKIGSFRRLLAAPLSKISLLAGKVLPNFTIGLIQTAVIFLFGFYGFKLMGLKPVQLGNDPLALIIVVILICLCSSALGIVIAAIARTEGQIGGLSSLFLWGLGILGGSIIPYFFLESFLGPVPKVLPHYWANRALDNVMIRGFGLEDVTLEIIVLLGFALFFFAIGLWRFDFD